MSDFSVINLPRPPQTPALYRFPVVATLAPVVLSVVLWLVTGSLIALLFAGLGPVTAVAGFVDGRVGSRRSRRRERLRFDTEVESVRSRIDALQAAEASDLDERNPAGAAIVRRRGPDHARWSGGATPSTKVSLGRATVASVVQTDQPARTSELDPHVHAALEELTQLAGSLDNAPLVADARLGIGIFGPPLLALSVARGLALQLAWSLSPQHFWCARLVSGDADSVWCEQLPHAPGPAVRGAYRFEFGMSGSSTALVSVAVATQPSELPGACRIVMGLSDSGEVCVIAHPERRVRQGVRADLVSRDDAFAWAVDAAQDAARHGLAQPNSALPLAVDLGPLLANAAEDNERAANSLAATVAVSATGPVVFDLVEHGPHAVVGGTTGSGKSELLIAWVIAMAAAHPPERVTFLLVDFKGGSAFGALALLPHTVGTITDLDARGAARALASLKAELTYRERALVDAGVRSIEATTAVPRLVIVVDEFAAMLAEHPHLHALFADLAARGRSLGVHLILCTQRPAGVVRDAVLANADLRVSLRVNNAADSAAVVATDAAAAIPAEARGRAIVRLAGAEAQLVQFAQAAEADIRRVAQRYDGSATPRRPWMEPLPNLVRAVPTEPSGTAFGLLDLPAEQRWGTAVWHPNSHGNVLVLGAGASGKSVALHALGGAGAQWIPDTADAAWDVLGQLTSLLERSMDSPTVVVDDIDVLLARFSVDHRVVVVERLTRLLREGAACGIRFVVSAQRLNGELLSLASLIPSRLWLRHASRQELLLAGGEAVTHDEAMPPGGGVWRGDRVQVIFSERMPREPVAPREVPVDATRPLAIVSPRAGWLAQQLARDNTVVELATLTGDPREAFAASSPGRVVLVGEVDEWQSRWGALAALRPLADILFHGCTPSDFRVLTRVRDLPPPVSTAPGLCWRLEADGTVVRARLQF